MKCGAKKCSCVLFYQTKDRSYQPIENSVQKPYYLVLYNHVVVDLIQENSCASGMYNVHCIWLPALALNHLAA